jgi:hypothetical protein
VQLFHVRKPGATSDGEAVALGVDDTSVATLGLGELEDDSSAEGEGLSGGLPVGSGVGEEVVGLGSGNSVGDGLTDGLVLGAIEGEALGLLLSFGVADGDANGATPPGNHWVMRGPGDSTVTPGPDGTCPFSLPPSTKET